MISQQSQISTFLTTTSWQQLMIFKWGEGSQEELREKRAKIERISFWIDDVTSAMVMWSEFFLGLNCFWSHFFADYWNCDATDGTLVTFLKIIWEFFEWNWFLWLTFLLWVMQDYLWNILDSWNSVDLSLLSYF